MEKQKSDDIYYKKINPSIEKAVGDKGVRINIKARIIDGWAMELSSRYGELDIVSKDEERLDVLINTSDDYAFADFVEVYNER